MSINTNIYGAPESWSAAQYLTFAKYANFNTAAAPQNTLLEGSARGKTPTGKLIENSICTQALGKESLYSNVVWVHDYPYTRYIVDERVQTPYFYAECQTADYNTQSNESSISVNYNYNSWSPYLTDSSYENKSAAAKPITEYQPKKILYVLRILAENTAGTANQTAIIGNYIQYPQFRQNYPYLRAAWLTPYVDTSGTSTPSREEINYNALFGVCPNIEINCDNDNIKINYGFWRSCQYNCIPLWGVFGSSNYFDNRYTGALCDPSDLVIDDNKVSAKRLIDDDLLEYLIQQAACFGVFVKTGTAGDVANVALDHNSVILGILDSDGVGHGEYTRGAANRDNPIWSWSTNRDSPYDPYKVPPSDKDTQSHFNNVSIANFNKVWVTSYNEVKDIIKEVYKALQRKPQDVQTSDYSADSFLSTDPINGIISIRRYPVNVVPNDNNPVYMTIGNYTSDTVQARRFINAPNSQFIDFVFSGTKRFDEIYDGSFLDREPYTTAELYIPFCGTVPISVADYIGHTITVKLAIDYLSGSCTAYVLCDNTPLQSANGQIGIDVPVSGINTATVDSQLLNANLRLKESQRQQLNASTAFFTTPFSLLMSASGGGKYGIASAAQGVGSLVSMGNNFESSWDNREAAAYELHHIQTPFKSVSAGSPLTAAMGEHCCRLTIYRPILSSDYDPVTYAKTIGFACLINGTVSDFSGLTMGTIDLSGVNCSDREKELIAAAFARGVIL